MCSETDETVPVSELMTTDQADSSTKTTRALGWQQSCRTQDCNGRRLLTYIAEGQSTIEIAGR